MKLSIPLALYIFIIFVLSRCAPATTLKFDPRSKTSDGIVYLSYEEELLPINEMQWEEALNIDWDNAQETANQICYNWNYDYAVRGNNPLKECLKHGPSGHCFRWLVIFDYECMDY